MSSDQQHRADDRWERAHQATDPVTPPARCQRRRADEQGRDHELHDKLEHRRRLARRLLATLDGRAGLAVEGALVPAPCQPQPSWVRMCSKAFEAKELRRIDPGGIPAA
jgi:hypothetical protein